MCERQREIKREGGRERGCEERKIKVNLSRFGSQNKRKYLF